MGWSGLPAAFSIAIGRNIRKEPLHGSDCYNRTGPRQEYFSGSCEVHHIVDARIAHSYVLLDLLDLMRQANVWPIAPSLGAEGMWPGPASAVGLRLRSRDADRGAAAIARVLQMHAALGTFDGKTVKSMDQAAYWHEDFFGMVHRALALPAACADFRRIIRYRS